MAWPLQNDRKRADDITSERERELEERRRDIEALTDKVTGLMTFIALVGKRARSSVCVCQLLLLLLLKPCSG